MFQHIIVVNGSYLSVVDGSILTLKRMTKYLSSCYQRVTVLCSPAPHEKGGDDGQDEHIETVSSLPMPFQPEYRLPTRLGSSARKLITHHDDTLVHLGAPDTLAIAALRTARRAGVPVVSSFHSNIVAYFKYLGIPRCMEVFGWRFFRWFYGQCDQVYVPTLSMQRELERHGVTAHYRLWPRGVDTGRFQPAKRSPAWRRAHGIRDGEKLVLFAARLKWEKGLDCLAGVIQQLHRQDPGIKSMIVGDGVARSELEKRLPDTAFPGFLEGEELATAYASADVFLYPSRTETFGNVTLEAMASGLPVVCAHAPGSSCLVRDGVNGHLVESDEIDRYAASVLRLTRCESSRTSMSRASVRLSMDYTWDRAFSMLEGYYRELWRAGAADWDPGTSVMREAS